MLHNGKILIVDSQRPSSSQLAQLVESLDGEVIGPVSSVADAKLILSHNVDVDGALLESEMPDGNITSVALKLLDKSVLIVIHSRFGIPHTLKFFYPKLALILKPGSVKAVMALVRLVLKRMSLFPKATRKTGIPLSRSVSDVSNSAATPL
jgi:DNA-binding NarL/FixJ family response regulator